MQRTALQCRKDVADFLFHHRDNVADNDVMAESEEKGDKSDGSVEIRPDSPVKSDGKTDEDSHEKGDKSDGSEEIPDKSDESTPSR